MSYKFQKKFKLKKKLESRDSCDPVKIDPLFYELVCGYFALEIPLKKRSKFLCLIVQPANVAKMLELEISARI